PQKARRLSGPPAPCPSTPRFGRLLLRFLPAQPAALGHVFAQPADPSQTGPPLGLAFGADLQIAQPAVLFDLLSYCLRTRRHLTIVERPQPRLGLGANLG